MATRAALRLLRPAIRRPARQIYPISGPSYVRATSTYHPAPLSAEDYHKLSDRAMDNILESLEEAIDAGVGRNAEEGWEVSYSSGVLTLSCGPHGTYVLNKQPPNQQIWLSSPLSGPKRYDYSLGAGAASGLESASLSVSEAEDGVSSSALAEAPSSSPSPPKHQTPETATAASETAENDQGVWFYTRDGSTLKQLMEAELAELAGESVGVWVERR